MKNKKIFLNIISLCNIIIVLLCCLYKKEDKVDDYKISISRTITTNYEDYKVKENIEDGYSSIYCQIQNNSYAINSKVIPEIKKTEKNTYSSSISNQIDNIKSNIEFIYNTLKDTYFINWEIGYKEILEKINELYSYETNEFSYCLYDLNKDKIPELIIKLYNGVGVNKEYYIFTISDEKCDFIDFIYAMDLYAVPENKSIMASVYNGAISYALYEHIYNKEHKGIQSSLYMYCEISDCEDFIIDKNGTSLHINENEFRQNWKEFVDNREVIPFTFVESQIINVDDFSEYIVE